MNTTQQLPQNAGDKVKVCVRTSIHVPVQSLPTNYSFEGQRPPVLNSKRSTTTSRSMWRFCSQHVHARGALALNCPVLPSGNSTLKIWRVGCDLHRLAIEDPCSLHERARNYTKHASSESRQNTKGLYDPKDLTPSDAQRRTIYALSTPPGKAGVAVVRISGPDALAVWQAIVQSKRKHPEPWKLERCRITDPQTGETLDDGLAVFFKGR